MTVHDGVLFFYADAENICNELGIYVSSSDRMLPWDIILNTVVPRYVGEPGNFIRHAVRRCCRSMISSIFMTVQAPTGVEWFSIDSNGSIQIVPNHSTDVTGSFTQKCALFPSAIKGTLWPDKR